MLSRQLSCGSLRLRLLGRLLLGVELLLLLLFCEGLLNLLLLQLLTVDVVLTGRRRVTRSGDGGRCSTLRQASVSPTGRLAHLHLPGLHDAVARRHPSRAPLGCKRCWLPRRRNIRWQQAAHRLHLVKGCLSPGRESTIDPRDSDNAPRSCGFREDGERRPRMAANEQLGIEAAARRAGCGRLGLRQGLLAVDDLCGGPLIGGDRGHHLSFQLCSLLLSSSEGLPGCRHCPQGSAQRDLQRLGRGELVAEPLYLQVEARRNVTQQRITGDRGLGCRETFKLPFKGLDCLGADKRGGCRPVTPLRSG